MALLLKKTVTAEVSTFWSARPKLAAVRLALTKIARSAPKDADVIVEMPEERYHAAVIRAEWNEWA
jgi:hypothetical protein